MFPRCLALRQFTRMPCRLGLFALAALAVQSAAGAATPPPNIVFVLSDDQSAQLLGVSGNRDIQTPHLNRIAAEGLRFSRAYVNSPQCVPSRASLATGRSPVALQMTRFTAPLPRSVTTFFDVLRHQAGYYTGILGRGYHLDGGEEAGPASEAVFAKHKLRTFKDRVDYLRVGSDNKVTEWLTEFLDQRPAGKPFCVWVGYSDPHRTFNAPPKHDPAGLTLPPFFPDTPAVRKDFAQLYDEVARLDTNVGELRQLLEARGLMDKSIFVFVGDNGSAVFRGKGTLNDWGIHVPFLVRWPGVVAPGTVSDDLVSGEDLAPTLIAAAGLVPPEEMTGRSLLPRLRGTPDAPPEYIFAERGAHGPGLPLGTADFDLSRTVVGQRYKLIYNVLWQLPYSPVDFGNQPHWLELVEQNKTGRLAEPWRSLYFQPNRPMFELYDLEHDEHEMHNLASDPKHAATLQKLKLALHEWMILEHDFVPLPLPRIKPGQ